MLEDKKKLKKELNFLDVFCLATGAMISSGLFVLPGIAHEQVGPALFISYFLGGLMALTGLLSQAELVSAMPKSGGAYFFVTRSMGPAVGTIQGILTWISLILKAAFALVGMAAFLKLIFPDIGTSMDKVPWVAILLAFFFLFLNALGAKKAGKAQSYLVFALIGSLVLYAIYSIPEMAVQNLTPFAPFGLEAIFITAGFIFISYGGLLKVASIAEEVKNADRVIPQAMIASLLVVTLFYTVIVLVTTGVLGAEKLNGNLTPLSTAAQMTMGNWGYILLSLAAVFSFITTANAGIMAAARYPLALGRDKLLPSVLSTLHEKYQTPIISIIFSGVVLILCLFLKLDILVELASTVLILTFIFSHCSVIIMRASKVQNYRPTFKSPLYPWVQIVGIILFMFILFEMSTKVFFVKLVLIGAAFLIYWFYGRLRSEQKFALLHIIERLTAKELVTGHLENELKEIVRERDEIVRDRFDHLVEECAVLDLDSRQTVESVFEKVSHLIAKDVKATPESIELKLFKRERAGSTVINEDIAIPHVITPGENHFNIVLVRCREGIIFNDEYQNVNAVFFLYGSQDERMFHLRALSAIAQIVSNPNFDDVWMRQTSEQGLRDAILLGTRRRNK